MRAGKRQERSKRGEAGGREERVRYRLKEGVGEREERVRERGRGNGEREERG